MVIMSVGRDYVFEVRRPEDLLFIPQMIYKHGEPWWNDVNRGKLLIHLPELWQSYQQSHLVASRRNGPCKVFLFIFASDFFTCLKFCDMGPPALFFPSGGKSAVD
jgi:hypothetical protein